MENGWSKFFMNVDWMEWAKAVFDLIKGTAWPFSVVFIVFIFRNELRDRIKDIVSVGMSGAVLQPPNQQTQSKPVTGLNKPTTHPLTTVQALIEKIDDQLKDIPDDARIPKLVYSLAEAQVEAGFETIWGAIFGSQIVALRRLKEAGSMSIDDVKRYYEEEVRPRYRDAFEDFSFDDWSQFLFLQNLIVKVESDRVSLTDHARDFLVFVDIRKVNLSRGL